jgi:hypothetical protein
MVEDILSKLKSELQQEITSERQIVYILVQIRKLINTVELAKKFEALKLHCDWVLHTALDKQSARRLLGILNDKFRELLNKGGNPQELRDLREYLGLQPFKDEFLNSFSTMDWTNHFVQRSGGLILSLNIHGLFWMALCSATRNQGGASTSSYCST